MKRLLFYHGLALALICVFLSILLSSITTTANNLGFGKKYAVATLLPEGWGFFTRDARGRQFVLYQEQLPTNKLTLVTHENASRENWLGLSRMSRRINMEFSRLLDRVPDNAWVERQGPTRFPAVAGGQVIVLDSADLKNQLCYLRKGNYVAVSYIPVPWAWSKYQEHYTPSFQFVHIRLR